MLLTLTFLACGPGGDGPPDGDAGADANDANDAGSDAELTRADIPWLADGVPPIALPMFTPCPAGWLEVVEEDPEDGMDVVTCHPYGATPGAAEPEVCPDGWAHFVGDEGCTPVGASCPLGDFPDGLPTDRAVLYVLSSAAVGGDGSRDSPLMTITDALNLASVGTVVAVGKGEYDEALRLPPGISLWGACAAETRLTASSPGRLAQGVITVPSAGVQVANLRIGPADLPGVVVYGVGASLSIDGIIIEAVRTAGLHVHTDGRMNGRELLVSGSRGDASGRFGHGVAADTGGTVDLTRVWISEAHDAGAFGFGVGTSLTLSDAVVYDTQGQEVDGVWGRGLHLMGGAVAEISRALFSHNRDTALYAGGPHTSLALIDVVVQDTQAREGDRGTGRGLSLEDGATAALARAVFSRNREVGVFVHGVGTSLTFTDVVVQDTMARQSDGTVGRGLDVEAGATATGTRAVLSHNREIAVLAGGAGASLTLSDVIVRDTQAQESDGGFGRALDVHLGARMEISRAALLRHHDLGVYANGLDTSLTLSDLVVRDTQGQAIDGTGGRGMSIQLGATAEVTRALFARSRDLGVFAGGQGTGVMLVDVIVTQTDEQACGATTCRDQPYGVGLLGVEDARLEAMRFEVRDAVLCGVMVAENGQVDLAEGLVAGSQVGVCLQVPGYSVPRLTNGVRFVDNQTNLDTTSLPVPEGARSAGEVR